MFTWYTHDILQKTHLHNKVWRCLNDNNFHPFRYQRVQASNSYEDFPARVQFSTWLLQQQRNFSKRIIFTNEGQFTRKGIFKNHFKLFSQFPKKVIRQIPEITDLLRSPLCYPKYLRLY